MNNFIKQSFWRKHFFRNKEWFKKLIILIVSFLIVLIPFIVFFNKYNVSSNNPHWASGPNIHISYNACTSYWAGDWRKFFRSHCMPFWIITTIILSFSALLFVNIIVNNKVLLASIDIMTFSLLCNFVNWVSDYRGALDYWCISNVLTPWEFFGLGKIVRGLKLENYTTSNWPDWTFWLSSDVFVISGIYSLVKIIREKLYLRKLLKTESCVVVNRRK